MLILEISNDALIGSYIGNKYLNLFSIFFVDTTPDEGKPPKQKFIIPI